MVSILLILNPRLLNFGLCITEEKEKTLVKVSETKSVSQATFLRQLMSAFSDSSPRYAASAAKAQAEKEAQVSVELFRGCV